MDEAEDRQLLKVFLCHSSGDKAVVRILYDKLEDEGVKPWLDEKELIAGQDWDQEITRAVRDSHIVIVCLSHESITKTGYVQREIRRALDVAQDHPEDTIFIIPLKLEECKVPERLSNLQWVNYYEEEGYDRLIRALRRRADSLGIEVYRAIAIRKPWELELVTIQLDEKLQLKLGLTKIFNLDESAHWEINYSLWKRVGNNFMADLKRQFGTGPALQRKAERLAIKGLSHEQRDFLAGEISEHAKRFPRDISYHNELEFLLKRLLKIG